MHAVSLIRDMPLLACARDRRGKIIAVTDRLAALEQRRPADLIGRNVTEVWPQGAPWLELDRLALKSRKPLIRIEHSPRVGWLRSTRVPQGRQLVFWFAEDVTAAVRLAALRALSDASALGRPLSREPEFIEALASNAGLETFFGDEFAMTFDQLAGACVRALGLGR